MGKQIKAGVEGGLAAQIIIIFSRKVSLIIIAPLKKDLTFPYNNFIFL